MMAKISVFAIFVEVIIYLSMTVPLSSIYLRQYHRKSTFLIDAYYKTKHCQVLRGFIVNSSKRRFLLKIDNEKMQYRQNQYFVNRKRNRTGTGNRTKLQFQQFYVSLFSISKTKLLARLHTFMRLKNFFQPKLIPG